jgi:hypothetical protein
MSPAGLQKTRISQNELGERHPSRSRPAGKRLHGPPGKRAKPAPPLAQDAAPADHQAVDIEISGKEGR